MLPDLGFTCLCEGRLENSNLLTHMTQIRPKGKRQIRVERELFRGAKSVNCVAFPTQKTQLNLKRRAKSA
jgi:hypothetical protein